MWRETTQFITWDSPVYEQFFEAVREVNDRLPAQQKWRVLAGDAPINWSQIKTHEQAMAFSDRDGHFAEVVERVILKGRRALPIAGGGHLYRAGDTDCCNVVQILERRHPGEVLVIKTHDPDSESAEAFVSSWPRGSAAMLAGTQLGQIEAGKLISQFEESGRRLEQVVDAYLYLAPFNEMKKVAPPASAYEDPNYRREIERRYKLVFQEPFPQEVWGQLRVNR